MSLPPLRLRIGNAPTFDCAEAPFFFDYDWQLDDPLNNGWTEVPCRHCAETITSTISCTRLDVHIECLEALADALRFRDTLILNNIRIVDKWLGEGCFNFSFIVSIVARPVRVVKPGEPCTSWDIGVDLRFARVLSMCGMWLGVSGACGFSNGIRPRIFCLSYSSASGAGLLR